MNELMLVLLSFIMVLIVTYLFIHGLTGGTDNIRERLTRIKENGQTEEQAIYNQPFSDRVLKPVLESIGKGLLKLAPTEWIRSMEHKIVMAGKPKNRSVKGWLSIQAMMTILIPCVLFFLFSQLHAPLKNTMMICAAAVAIGVLYPNMVLNSKIRQRHTEILKTLPDVMDLLTVSVEAGLNFDSALAKVVEKMPGTLSKEFDMVLQEIKVGRSKKEALYDMADRLNVQDLRSFIGSVVQADQLGVSLGRVLRIQSEQIRLNRKQRIQEQAMKAPIKILIPMVIFIFPVIFIVLLGPVVINLMEMFTNW